MIFGGNWTSQNKKTPGVFINFVSKKSTSTTPVKPTVYLLLADSNGVLLKTADGLYLSVKE